MLASAPLLFVQAAFLEERRVPRGAWTNGTRILCQVQCWQGFGYLFSLSHSFPFHQLLVRSPLPCTRPMSGSKMQWLGSQKTRRQVAAWRLASTSNVCTTSES